MVELVGGPDGLAQREVTRQYHVFALQGDDEGALYGPRADARNGGELGHQFLVRQAAQYVQVRRPSDIRWARSRSVLTFRHENPAARSWSGATLSSSAGAGR